MRVRVYASAIVYVRVHVYVCVCMRVSLRFPPGLCPVAWFWAAGPSNASFDN